MQRMGKLVCAIQTRLVLKFQRKIFQVSKHLVKDHSSIHHSCAHAYAPQRNDELPTFKWCQVPGASAGAGCRVPGAGCWVPSAGCRVPGAEYWVPGTGCLYLLVTFFFKSTWIHNTNILSYSRFIDVLQQNLIRSKCQGSGFEVSANLSFKVNISAFKASIPTNEKPTLMLTIKEHYASHYDKPLVKAKLISLEPAKSVYRVSQKEVLTYKNS